MGLNSFALGFNVDFFTCSVTGPSSLSSPLGGCHFGLDKMAGVVLAPQCLLWVLG